MVYAGTDVEAGLLSEVERPWVAIGARSGEYRAITAPDLPPAQPGAVALNEGGDRLAWATGDGVEVYDPATGTARLVPLEGASRVGHFSPDGSLLTVHADGLALLDLASGDVVAEAEDTDPDVVRLAAWRADSSAVDYVQGQRPGHPARGRRGAEQPALTLRGGIAPGLGTDRRAAGGAAGRRRRPHPARRHRRMTTGQLGEARTVDTSGISLDGLLGFSGDDTVAVRAFLLESGNVERVLDVPLDGGSPST